VSIFAGAVKEAGTNGKGVVVAVVFRRRRPRGAVRARAV
jgi:hypothetical protein